MRNRAMTAILLCILSTTVHPLLAQGSGKYFTITVIDQKTGRGVPMVQLRTSSRRCYYTDSNGIIAFDEPSLMNQRVYFAVYSHGYECPKDGLGNRNVLLNTVPGAGAVIKLRRLNIAERLYRITGEDIYGESARVGRSIPITHQGLNGKVMGQDTFLETLYRGKLYWFWGDTEGPAGFNGRASGATSELPGKGGLDPAVGIDLTYFIDTSGFSKPICPFPGETLVWLEWLATLPDETGSERLYAEYMRINKDGNPGESGFAVFNDSTQTFERIRVVQEWYGTEHRIGHPCTVRAEGLEYLYFINYAGIARVRRDFRHLTDPASYENFTCFAAAPDSGSTAARLERDLSGKLVYGWKSNAPSLNHRQQSQVATAGKISVDEGLWQFEDVVTGKSVSVDPASVFWNNYRKRWVMIAYEFAGGVWFFEGDTPTGPWVYGRKIVAHDNYDFYNVGQHPVFDQDAGRLIYFEGTYTTGFSGNTNPTPLYDYNQMMYRLALDDRRLSLPAPVYCVKDERGNELYLMREGIDSLHLWEHIQSIPFFALPVSRSNDDVVPVYAGESARSAILTTLPLSSRATRPVFYALPTVAIPRSQHDPITGTWKCKAQAPDGTEPEFELTLEKDGSDITGSNVTAGRFKNDTLTLALHILDYSLTGSLGGGRLMGAFKKDDGTESGSWGGVRVGMPPDEPISSSVVILFEYRKADGEERCYSVDSTLSGTSLSRTAQPICRVWRNPSSVLALDQRAKPVQPGR
jgi:hypothetical protein